MDAACFNDWWSALGGAWWQLLVIPGFQDGSDKALLKIQSLLDFGAGSCFYSMSLT